jgi:lipoprotein-anchoring transpeptidase ErfK/SrfK
MTGAGAGGGAAGTARGTVGAAPYAVPRARRTARGPLAVLAASVAALAVLVAGCGSGGGSDGKPHGSASPRPTAKPPTFVGIYSPEQGTTVGTGMIISLDFTRDITDRAAVERGVSVTSVPPVEVTGHWFGDRRLDLRPARFWRAGTRVTLHLRLRGVQGAPGVRGTQSKDMSFAIGRDQHSTVDVLAHTMTVVRDGRPLRVLPISAGSDAHTTYNGIMTISEKYAVTRMNGSTVGFGGEYDIPDVPHAMRLTASGTFVHGNYWSPPGVFGTANVSHGCVGLRDVKGGGTKTPAGWFYGQSLVGDTVEVVNSPDAVVAPDNGMSGWNLSWPEWTAGSAL